MKTFEANIQGVRWGEKYESNHSVVVHARNLRHAKKLMAERYIVLEVVESLHESSRMPTARFWTWEKNGWVKISLKPGQSASHGSFERDDEGWSSSHTRYEYHGEYVYEHWLTDGRDCDGRLTRSGVRRCHVSDLAAYPAYGGPNHPVNIHDGKLIMRAEFEVYKRERVYDQFAQMANY